MGSLGKGEEGFRGVEAQAATVVPPPLPISPELEGLANRGAAGALDAPDANPVTKVSLLSVTLHKATVNKEP